MITPFVSFTLKNNDQVRVCGISHATGMDLFYQTKENAGSPLPHYSDHHNFAALPDRFKAQAALILATQRLVIKPTLGSSDYDHVQSSVGAPYRVSINQSLVQDLPDPRWFIPSIGQALTEAVKVKAREFRVVASKGSGLLYPNTVTPFEIAALTDLELINPENLIPWVPVYRRTNDPKLDCLQYMLTSRGVATRRSTPSLHAPSLEVPEWHANLAWILLGEKLGNRTIDDIPDSDPMWHEFMG